MEQVGWLLFSSREVPSGAAVAPVRRDPGGAPSHSGGALAGRLMSHSPGEERGAPFHSQVVQEGSSSRWNFQWNVAKMDFQALLFNLEGILIPQLLSMI